VKKRVVSRVEMQLAHLIGLSLAPSLVRQHSGDSLGKSSLSVINMANCSNVEVRLVTD